ncbi:MAG: hypothetical protein WDZ85_03495 [Candidatus Paceibacterota bacterium]
MTYEQVKSKKIPDCPGVYFFKQGRTILYIGKATSLKDRLRSYFTGDLLTSRGPRLVKMITEATGLSWQETDSVLEALLLEATLIKKFQPIYNIRERDDKSFWHIAVTKEAWPRVLPVRGRDLAAGKVGEIKYLFGPFPQAGELKTALKIIRQIIPFRDKCLPALSQENGRAQTGQGRPCFARQLGLCPGVCTGEIDKKTYRRQIDSLCLLLSGRKEAAVKSLTAEMKVAAGRRDFELAAVKRNQLFALKHIRDVSLIGRRRSEVGGHQRIEAYDISHQAGRFIVGAMAVVSGGEVELSAYRRFKIKDETANRGDVANLKEIITRRWNHLDWPEPNLIVVDGGRAQVNAATKTLANRAITIVGVVKDEYHRPRKIIGPAGPVKKFTREILLANSEAHRFALAYHRRLRKN